MLAASSRLLARGDEVRLLSPGPRLAPPLAFGFLFQFFELDPTPEGSGEIGD
jgi:hypothetical protein